MLDDYSHIFSEYLSYLYLCTALANTNHHRPPPPSPHMTHLTKICCTFQFDRRGSSLFAPTAQRLTVCTPCVCEQTIPRQLGWPELPPEPRPVYFGAPLLRCYPHTHPYTYAHNNNILIYYMDLVPMQCCDIIEEDWEMYNTKCDMAL